MFLDNQDKSLCTGCTACDAICPVSAIKMEYDSEGFKYPVIDNEKCINCGMCKKVCPNLEKAKNRIVKTYGVKHKNLQERKTSRSGGVFVAISDYILKRGGVIYGVVQNKDFSVCHLRAETKEERDAFKGSKYVQSNMDGIIKQIKKDLEDGRKVLYSGTACQVAGVRAAIPEKLHENLYCTDLICHGVPSVKIFEEYLKYIEEKENKKIKEFIFRDKDYGWSPHYETFIFEDGSKKTVQYFRNMFLRDKILRPSCYSCNYASPYRPADITIADFWGIDKINPEFYDEIGVSLVTVNSDKGIEIFENIKEELDWFEASVQEVIDRTYNLDHPTEKPEDREEFWKDYEKESFEFIIDKYAK